MPVASRVPPPSPGEIHLPAGLAAESTSLARGAARGMAAPASDMNSAVLFPLRWHMMYSLAQAPLERWQAVEMAVVPLVSAVNSSVTPRLAQ